MSRDTNRSPEEVVADIEALVREYRAKVDQRHQAEGKPLIDWDEWSREAHRRFIERAAKTPECDSIRLRFPSGDSMTLLLEPDGSMSPAVKEQVDLVNRAWQEVESDERVDDSVLDLKTLAQTVGKSVPFVLTIQKKYGLTPCREFSGGHAVLVSKLVYLSICSVPDKTIKELLKSERRLLELLKVDSLHERPDWFESLCTMKSGPTRLLLSGFDIGYALSGNMVQAGLDFSERDKELFEDHEMGSDALVGLKLYTEILDRVRTKVQQEVAVVEDALHWCREIR